MQANDLLTDYHVRLVKVRNGLSEVFEATGQQNHLLYISSGRGKIILNNEVIALEKYTSHYIDRGRFVVTAATTMLCVYILSWPKERDMISAYLLDSFAQIPSSQVIPIWEELRRSQNETSISAICHFQSLVWKLLATITDVAKMDQIEQVVHYIRSNLDSQISIKDLATKASMSTVTFSRLFRKRMGCAPKEFLIEERIKAAKKIMLQEKDVTAKEVAFQVGIQDEFYFSRLFKSKEGIPPTGYLKRVSPRVAVVSQLFLQDHLLALGIQPVAAPSYPSVYPLTRGVPSYLEKELYGTMLLNAESPFQPLEVLSAQPESIIKTPLHNGDLQRILFSHQEKVHHLSLKTSWNHYLQEIAILVGQETRAEEIEKEIHQLELKVRDELCPITKKGSWAVVWIRSKEIRLYGKENHAVVDLLFQKLGFQPHPDIPSEGYKSITLDELVTLNPEKLLILWSNETDVWRLAHMPEWKLIRAVETGEVYYPISYEWDPWGPIGRKQLLLQFSDSMKKGKLKI
ncbi:helix-turn-helix domain-containing protein [Robertmurraya sp. P23]|uniref:ABC transporter substrate-binding protein n=1 Tax=Robertmurraya sp. P23 TaxID=3436931 RepID=UPI003D95CFB8